MKTPKAKVAGITLLIAVILVAWRVIDILPVIGDPNSPPNTHISETFIEEGPKETNSPNLVTGVLADYRGFDTLLETTVMYLAGFAVSMILSNKMKEKWDRGIFGNATKFGGLEVRVIMPLIVPLMLIYGVYVLFHGEVSLGGGFQAGALIALAYIIYTLIGGIEIKRVKVTQHFAVCVAAVGVVIYAVTGLVPMFFGGQFLEYSKLPIAGEHGSELHSTGILLVEIGVALCVCATIINILEAVLERNSINDRN